MLRKRIHMQKNYTNVLATRDGGAPYGMTWEEIIADELKIRVAVKKDAKKAVELTDIAEQLTGQTKKENIRKTLSQLFREDNNRLSYQNMIVADILGEVAGIIITYPGTQGQVHCPSSYIYKSLTILTR